MPRPDDVRSRGPHGRSLRPPGAVSLARALSKFGVASRREAERWIRAGRVRVNGRQTLLPERRIVPRRDRVVVDGRLVGEDVRRVVIALHKPKGCVTTRVDPAGRPTVYDVMGELSRWVFPVGRLDRDTSGLLVLTNDHRLGQRLTAPEQRVSKTYHARVRGVPDREALRALREGLALDGGVVTRPAQVRVLGTLSGAATRPLRQPARGTAASSTWLEIVLTEGKNRQVRRMGAAVGHEVLDLMRVAIGALPLGDLAPGEWRELGPAEVARLAGREARAIGDEAGPEAGMMAFPEGGSRPARSPRGPSRRSR